jgi:hypothetical protein
MLDAMMILLRTKMCSVDSGQSRTEACTVRDIHDPCARDVLMDDRYAHIRDSVGATMAEMGLILVNRRSVPLWASSLPAPLVFPLGTRNIITVGMLLVVASILVVGIGAALSSGM